MNQLRPLTPGQDTGSRLAGRQRPRAGSSGKPPAALRLETCSLLILTGAGGGQRVKNRKVLRLRKKYKMRRTVGNSPNILYKKSLFFSARPAVTQKHKFQTKKTRLPENIFVLLCSPPSVCLAFCLRPHLLAGPETKWKAIWFCLPAAGCRRHEQETNFRNNFKPFRNCGRAPYNHLFN